MSQVTLEQVGTALGALTNLTTLSFSASGSLQGLEHLRVMEQLRKLLSLVDLSLLFCDDSDEREGEDKARLDMLQLSALTNLTRLQVDDITDVGFGDVAASVVALSLTRLQELSVYSMSLLSWGFLPVVARLISHRASHDWPA
jgi:hypothetical protein